MSDSTNDLAFIQLANETRLGVHLGKPVMVFTLPSWEGFITGNSPLFGPSSRGPSESHAEEIAALIKRDFGRDVAAENMIACWFEQDALGRVTTPIVSKWSFKNGFLATGLQQPNREVDALREILLLNPAQDFSVVSPLLQSRSFAESGYLQGLIGESGYRGMLSYNGVSVPIPDRQALERLSDESTYSESFGSFVGVDLSGCRLTLSEHDAQSLQEQARAALNEVDLRRAQNAHANLHSASMPQIVSFLRSAVETQISSVNAPDQSKSGSSVRDTLDDLGRVKSVIEVLASAASVAGGPKVSLAILLGTYVLGRFRKAERPGPEHPRERP